MKTLPKNLSIEEITKMDIKDTCQYKNKFLQVEETEKGFNLVYFLNAYQSYSKHQAVANRKVKELFKKGLLPNLSPYAAVNLSFLGGDHTRKHLVSYEYEVRG